MFVLFHLFKLHLTPSVSSILVVPTLGNKPSTRSNNIPHRPVTTWLKHGFVCLFLPRKDLTVFMDIEPNPGPLDPQSSSFQPSRVLFESSVSQVFDNYSRLLLISNNKPACFIHTRDDLINIRRLGFYKPSNSDLFNMKSLGILRYRGVRSGKAVKTKRQLEKMMIPTIITANRPRIINSRSVNVSNAIYPSKVESAQSILPRLSFAVWNARSIHRKAAVICDIITSNRLSSLLRNLGLTLRIMSPLREY